MTGTGESKWFKKKTIREERFFSWLIAYDKEEAIVADRNGVCLPEWPVEGNQFTNGAASNDVQISEARYRRLQQSPAQSATTPA